MRDITVGLETQGVRLRCGLRLMRFFGCRALVLLQHRFPCSVEEYFTTLRHAVETCRRLIFRGQGSNGKEGRRYTKEDRGGEELEASLEHSEEQKRWSGQRPELATEEQLELG